MSNKPANTWSESVVKKIRAVSVETTSVYGVHHSDCMTILVDCKYGSHVIKDHLTIMFKLGTDKQRPQTCKEVLRLFGGLGEGGS